MRNLQFLAIILLLFAIGVACESTTSNSDETTETHSAPEAQFVADGGKPKLPPNAISATTLADWEKNWRENACSWMDSNRLEGFKMPLLDLDSIISEHATSAYFVLGLDSNNEAKLAVVGLDANNTPMLNTSKGEYAYDLTARCPPNCPPSSSSTRGGGNCNN